MGAAVAAAKGRVPVIIDDVMPWTYLSPALLCRIFREVHGVIGQRSQVEARQV